jgi:hypothetical protein
MIKKPPASNQPRRAPCRCASCCIDRANVSDWIEDEMAVPIAAPTRFLPFCLTLQ